MLDLLIVDDEPLVRNLLSSFAASQGWHCAACAAAPEALARLAAEPARLVLSDINMPGMDGVQLARRIKAEWPDIGVVAYTGSVEELDLHPSDFDQVVSKPCPLEELAVILEHHLCRLGWCPASHPAPRAGL